MQYEYHTPVLVDDVIKYLITKLDGVYVDATLGGGGHSEKILEKLLPTGVLVGIDADEDAVKFSKRRFGERVLILQGNFSHLSKILSEHNTSKVDGILFDLGISSYQIDNPEKGFSFREGGKLDFRFDKRQKLDAHAVINTYTQEKLSDIFWNYGEEKFSNRIAQKIIKERSFKTIDTTTKLVEIIQSVVSRRFLNKSLARIFQAVRIEVNDELTALKEGLENAVQVLNRGGRIVVISYHSLEDRIVKEYFKEKSKEKIRSEDKLIPDIEIIPVLKIMTKKPIIPSEIEERDNPRARSAKLRAAEKL